MKRLPLTILVFVLAATLAGCFNTGPTPAPLMTATSQSECERQGGVWRVPANVCEYAPPTLR